MSNFDTKENAFGDLSGKTAIVTGAAGGIGRAIVNALRDAGAQVVAVDKSPKVTELFTDFQDVHPFPVDIGAEGSAEAIVADCISRFGKLDIVVNNAGIVIAEPLESISDLSWDRTLSINTTAVMRISRAAAPHLKQSGWGRIVNIGSTSSAFAEAGHAAYCASKHALAGLTKAVALDLGKHGVTVNYIMPGFIATPMAIDNYDQSLIENWRLGTALGRIGKPEDIAGVVIFLLTEQAGYMTGAGLVVDGGHSLHE